MQLIPFDKDKHFHILNSWIRSRGIKPELSMLDIPAWGCVVSEGDTVVACGFIRQVEGGFAQLDGFATNPKAPIELRDRAQDMAAQKLIKYAKYKKIKGLICNSTHANTIKRAVKHGFVVIPHTLFALDLRSL